jgi:hypothetical protein
MANGTSYEAPQYAAFSNLLLHSNTKKLCFDVILVLEFYKKI